MRRKKLTHFFTILLLTGFITLRPQLLHSSQIVSIAQSLGLIKTAADFITDPSLFFQGVQYDADDLSPSFFKQYYSPEWRSITQSDLDNISRSSWADRFSISSNLLSDLFFLFNYSLKGHALKESIYMPQITIGFSHFILVPGYTLAANDAYRHIFSQGFGLSLIFSKSITSTAKFFSGYRYAYGYLDINIPRKAISDAFAIAVTAFAKDTLSQDGIKVNTGWHLHDLIFGVTLLPNNSAWQSMMLIGYNPAIQRVFVKAERRIRYWGFGVGYYPDNILSIRPYIRFYITI